MTHLLEADHPPSAEWSAKRHDASSGNASNGRASNGRASNVSVSGGSNLGVSTRRVWNRFSLSQIIVMALASIAPAVILGAIALRLVGIMETEQMLEVALAAGENPGMLTFGAMFLASPIQWLTGRSQIRVRKFLGISFYALALSNGVMFVVERGVSLALSEPLLIAGSVAFALATPLFLTSSRSSQRLLGMARWRLLHRLTYVIAAALLAHVILIGDIGPGSVMIAIGFMARIPAARRWLENRRGGATAQSASVARNSHTQLTPDSAGALISSSSSRMSR